MKHGVIGLLALALAGPGTVDAADNWPRFRGPNGAGVARDQDIPVRWSAADVLWKTRLPGAGNSSPVVWGNRLFLESATANERLLLCVDVPRGKVLWRRALAGTVTRKHPKNSFASSTPATDGERVYSVFWDGRRVLLAAYGLDGKPLWRRDLGTFTSQHGVGASPVVFGGKVFLNNDQDGAAELVALDARTGEVAWRKKRRAFRACYSTPLVLDAGGKKPQLIVVSTAGVTSYNAQTGEVNWYWEWQFSGMALRTVGSPVAAHGIIFASSGDGSGARHMVAVKAGGKGDVTATNLLWERRRGYPYVPSMLVRGDFLYYIHDNGVAGCVEARTGKPVWTERLGDKFTASPVLIDGKIYAPAEGGDVYVLAAEPTFKLLAKNSVDEPVFASPAVAGRRLFIRGAEHLFCIGKREKSKK